MRKWILAILALPCACLMAWAQAQPNRFPPINLVAGDPTGTACPANSLVQSSASGLLYTCQSGTFHGSSPVDPSRVTWPPSCTTGVYAPATNTCVAAGTANNPGGSPGQMQFNSGGIFAGFGNYNNATSTVTFPGPAVAPIFTVTGTPSAATDAATVGYVNSHSGGTLAPSGDTTGATDGAAIAAGCAATGSVQLKAAKYYVGAGNASISLASPCAIMGAGPSATIIENHGTTNTVFSVTYGNFYTAGVSPSMIAARISNLTIQQAPGITPTAGGAVLIGSGCTTSCGQNYTAHLMVDHALILDTWNGLHFRAGNLANWVDTVRYQSSVTGGQGCIYYDVPVPSGGNQISNVDCGGTNSDYVIPQSDTTNNTNITMSQGVLKFTQAGSASNMTFTNFVTEDVVGTCAIDFGTGTHQPARIIFNGGKVDNASQAFCHAGTMAIPNGVTVSNFTFAGVTTIDGSTAPSLAQSYSWGTTFPGAGTGNYVGTPALPCTVGQYAMDSTHIYTCYATNLWNVATAAPYLLVYQEADTFTGASGPLTAHTSDKGHTWAAYTVAGDTDAVSINGSGYIVDSNGSVGTGGTYINSLTPSSADYTVSLTCTVDGGTTSFCAVDGRMITGASFSYYFAQWSAGKVLVYKQVAGVFGGQVGGNTCTLATSGTHTIGLKMAGNQISTLVDGILCMSPVTDSSISAAGQAGLRLSGASTTRATNFIVQ